MTPERIQDIIQELMGTPLALDNVLEDGEDAMDKQLCAAIDDQIFNCNICGWWCEMSEMSEKKEWTCTDCEND